MLKSRPTYICFFYRAPDSVVQSSLEEIDQQMTNFNISWSTCNLVMLGDMNIDYAKTSLYKRKLDSFLDKFDLSQVITQPTRISNTSANLLDHTYVNNYDRYHHQGVVDPGLSDHSLVFVRKETFETYQRKGIYFCKRLSLL